ncbi:MAG: hypothetical protein ACR2PF_11910 [Rhizobiaceae bacterium]
MAYNSLKNNCNFNDMIELGMRRARVERSRAFFGLFDRIGGKGRMARKLSDA